MAIYKLSSTIIKRSKGDSIVKIAAYRAGAVFYDQRLGCTFNYSKYKGLDYEKILFPEDSPEWIIDRESLWNEVEKSEKRCDSQLAREIMVAIPTELQNDLKISLIEKFVYENFVSIGMIADIFIHGIDSHNPHAHILLTMRLITKDGFGLKNKKWNSKENLFKWRESWADLANKCLSDAGLNIKISHKSLADQDIPLEPQPRLGAVKNMPSHKAIETDKMKEYLDVRRRNGERIKKAPEIAFLILGLSRNSFSKSDFEKIAKTYSADEVQYLEVLKEIENCEYLESLEYSYEDGNKIYRFK